MKTLKFMLAAATAIGLASASQAAGPYDGSTDFESDTLNSTITTSDGYWTVPTGAEDGDYTVVSGVPSSALRSAGAASAFTTTPAQVLQLEGGTDPLTRNIQATGAAVDLTAGDVYIDTLVQFTVTPAGDTVTAGASDKLLIYLKEDLTEGSETTNLMVKACAYTASPRPGVAATFVTNDIPLTAVVEPGTWYNLRVKSYVDDAGVLLFEVYLNGTRLASTTSLYSGEEVLGTVFPALTGMGSTSLTSVGFAGSGAVDDLLFTTFNPDYTVVDFYLALVDANGGIPGNVSYSTSGDSGTLGVAATGANGQQIFCAYDANNGSPSVTVTYTLSSGFIASWSNGTTANGNDTFAPAAGTKYTLTVTPEITAVDFTFALGTGVSGVTWTLNGTTQSGLTAQVAAGDVLAITGVTYADWYVGTGDYVKNWTKTLAAADVAENFTYTVAAEKATGPVIIADSTTAADLGITNPKFANDSAAQLSKLATWAQSLTTPLTIAQVNAMTFADGDLNSEAFLLNCENSAEAVAAAKAEFKFSAITPGTVPSVDTPTRGYNVEPVIYGGATLDAITVTPATSAHKFYKAVLTK